MINVSEQINAVSRTVGSRELPAGTARTTTVSQTYPTPAEDLWNAVTTPERISRWFLPVTGEPKIGGSYQIEGNASGTIQACQAPEYFNATWEYGGEVSWIEVRVEAISATESRFVLDHIAHVDDARWAQFGPGAVGMGWDMTLIGLALHFATGGRPNDTAEVQAWLTSADGIDFMTQSSQRWCAATILAGDDPTAAQSAAQRCLGAYTGVPVSE